MTDTYMVYADELKEVLLSDQTTHLIVYGSDGKKVEYYRADSIQTMTREEHEALHKHTDCISRQDAIDAFYKHPNVDWTTLDVLAEIKALPSVQPTTEELENAYAHGYTDAEEKYRSVQPVIQCKDCKHWREHKYAKETKRYIPFCGFNAIYTKADDFCSRAERRTDE